MSSQLVYPTLLAAPLQNHLSSLTNKPEMSRSLSSFAQTMLEEDAKFYATFPEARRAAIEQQWRFQQIPSDQYFEGPGFQYCPKPGTYAAASNYDHHLDAYAKCAADGYAPAYRSEAPFMSHTVYVGSASVEGPGSSVLPFEPIHHGWTEQQNGWEVDHLVQHHTTNNGFEPASTVCAPSPMLPSITQDLIHPVVPSHQPLINRGLIRPLMIPPIDVHLHRSPSRSEKISTSPASACTTISSSPSPRGDRVSPTLQQLFSSVSLTGNWQTDEAIINGHKLHAPVPRHPCVLDTSSLDASVISPSTRSCQPTKELRKTRRSQSHPYIGAKETPRPSSRMRLSAPPIKGRAKKLSQSKPSKTKPAQPRPPLACLFCRGRKIACGAPPAESEKKTCHQCDKRGLRCLFPLESYRGMRMRQAKVREIQAKGVLNWNSD